MLQSKYNEAEKLFNEYMELDKNNVHARLELGKLKVLQGKYNEAEKLFDEGIVLQLFNTIVVALTLTKDKINSPSNINSLFTFILKYELTRSNRSINNVKNVENNLICVLRIKITLKYQYNTL